MNMATIQMTKYTKKRKPETAPAEFIEDCKVLSPEFEKIKPKVQKVYDKWIGKGKRPKTIGKWLKEQLKQWYTSRHVSRLIPEEAHRKYVESGKYVGWTKNGKTVPVTERPKNVPLQSDNLSNCHTGSTHESPKETKKIGSLRTEPLKTHERGLPGRINQDPDEYEIDKLETYDIGYLIEIIKHLHNIRQEFIEQGFKWQKRYDEMYLEKEALKEKLDKSRTTKGGVA